MLNYAYMCFPYKKEISLKAKIMFYSHLYHNLTVPRITLMTIDLFTLAPTATPGKRSNTRYWDLILFFNSGCEHSKNSE